MKDRCRRVHKAVIYVIQVNVYEKVVVMFCSSFRRGPYIILYDGQRSTPILQSLLVKKICIVQAGGGLVF